MASFLQLLEGTQTGKYYWLGFGRHQTLLSLYCLLQMDVLSISVFHMDPQLVGAKQTLTDCTVTKLRTIF